jgi:phytoene dehydrogenase-like protein
MHAFDTLVVCLQSEKARKETLKEQQTFQLREQWLEEMEKEWDAALLAAGKDAIRSIRSYTQTLEELAAKSSIDTAKYMKVCAKLRASCDKLEAMPLF